MDLKTTEALIDGCCRLVLASVLDGGGGPVTVTGGNVLVFILKN